MERSHLAAVLACALGISAVQCALAQDEGGGFANENEQSDDELKARLAESIADKEQLQQDPVCTSEDPGYNKRKCDTIMLGLDRSIANHRKMLEDRASQAPAPASCDLAGVAENPKAEKEFCNRCGHLCKQNHLGNLRPKARVDAEIAERNKEDAARGAAKKKTGASRSKGGCPEYQSLLNACLPSCENKSETTKPKKSWCVKTHCPRKARAECAGLRTKRADENLPH